jgi:hypothetical protein
MELGTGLVLIVWLMGLYWKFVYVLAKWGWVTLLRVENDNIKGVRLV